MSLLNKFENRYIIEGTLITESPLHIGAGINDFIPTAVDAAVIRDENNTPYIPGTSLKGVLRSNIEKLVATGVLGNLKACNILIQNGDSSEDTENYYNHICVDDKTIKDIKKSVEENKKIKNKEEAIAQEIYAKQCDICKLFGGHGFASKIQINDSRALISEGEKVYTQIRDGVAIDRDTLTKRDKAKYTFEQVAVGTKFDFKMTIDNLDSEHKVLFKLLITLLESGEIRIGGKTSAGLGLIRLIDKKMYLIQGKEGLRSFYINNEIKNIGMEEL
ncbi:MAG: CRISPR-associated RAMP protein [Clostridium sp.]|nr:CRISPR-associated RAMP protein [Clostridium sp.]